jgi:hypothetical protein
MPIDLKTNDIELKPVRIVVSGTHASGKSTLIADFCATHPGFAHLPDPFELLDDFDDQPHPSSFLAQLAISAQRLEEIEPDTDVIAERGPLDFLAYLISWESLGGGGLPEEVLHQALALSASAMQNVDLLVLLPLNSADHIWVHPEESLELRAAMNDTLLELSDDPDLLGSQARMVEIVGDRQTRLSTLEASVNQRWNS